MGSTIHSQPVGWLVFFFLIIGEVGALDCNNVNDRESCLEILNDDELTDEEKEMLISALIYQNYYADHDFIYDWNRDIELDYEGEDAGYIKNAWVKIKGISPSVIIDDELYTTSRGRILTEHDYDIDIYYRNYRRDCRTEYVIEEERARLRIYSNGRYIDNERETEFEIDEDIRFHARFDVYLRTRIEHYRKDDGECKFHHNSIREHDIVLHDYLYVNYYEHEPSFNFEVLNDNSFRADLDEGYLNIEFEDSYYNSFNYFYGLVFDDGLITLKAFPYNITDFRNIIVSDGVFHVKNNNECEIVYGDHFNSYEYECNFDYEEYNLRIETDKLSYGLDESILVSVYPDNEEVRLSYGGEEVNVRGSYEFEVVSPYNKIEAELGNEESYKVIHVKEGNLNVLFSLGMFFGISYVLYVVVRKCYRRG